MTGDGREQRSRLEALQTELKQLEQQRADLEPQIGPATRDAEAAEAAHEAVQVALWKARTQNARFEGEPPINSRVPGCLLSFAVVFLVLTILGVLLELSC